MMAQAESMLTLAASIAVAGWAAVAASCAAAQMHQPATVVAPVPAELRLPQPPRGVASAPAPVLRVTVTPIASGVTWPALLQPKLRVVGELGAGVKLPPWTLYPPGEPATFSVPVPSVIHQALRRGQAIHLTVTATPLDAVAAQGLAAPTFRVKAAWGPP